MWHQLKLKCDEALYFCSQLEAHTRYPVIFLFHLSAFLSSARSVTFHLQKKYGSKDDGIYNELREQLLSDPICTYFVNLRNLSEKEGYPTLEVFSYFGVERKETNDIVWTCHSSCRVFNPEDNSGLELLDNMLRNQWELARLSGVPEHLKLVYKFPDFPESEKDVVKVCRKFSDRLWHFLARYRFAWESQHDPGAHRRTFESYL